MRRLHAVAPVGRDAQPVEPPLRRRRLVGRLGRRAGVGHDDAPDVAGTTQFLVRVDLAGAGSTLEAFTAETITQINRPSLPKLTRELKRRTFPVALLAMLVPIAAAATGTAAGRKEWPWQYHALLAAATLLVNAWAFIVEYRNVAINAGIIDEVMHEVERIRAERGLPSNEEALREERSA